MCLVAGKLEVVFGGNCMGLGAAVDSRGGQLGYHVRGSDKFQVGNGRAKCKPCPYVCCLDGNMTRNPFAE
jgi:hypothetical protein